MNRENPVDFWRDEKLRLLGEKGPRRPSKSEKPAEEIQKALHHSGCWCGGGRHDGYKRRKEAGVHVFLIEYFQEKKKQIEPSVIGLKKGNNEKIMSSLYLS